MPPAARAADLLTCPLTTPVPHLVGLILPPCCPTVQIGYLPAARVTDWIQCLGGIATIAKGSATVLIGHKMAARLGDCTTHGGVITRGEPTVLIGG
jgi:uncharacterized Zn-binding protein involved in type VI secretion